MAPEPAMSAGPLQRDNSDWTRELAGSGPGAEEARRALRSLLVRGLSRALSSRGVSPDACEDFAQEALVRVLARLGDFRGESRFTSWALAIATRVAFDELRHKRWKDVSFEALTAESRAPLQFEPLASADQEKGLVRQELLDGLREVIERRLTERQRAVLVAELSGMPHAEIAAQLQMNRNALYKLAHDARRRVRQHLEEMGLGAGALWAFETEEGP